MPILILFAAAFFCACGGDAYCGSVMLLPFPPFVCFCAFFFDHGLDAAFWI